jgi:hypothetical protein
METQIDYEAEIHMAVFRSAEPAEVAARALRSAGIEHIRTPLPPGRYQVADPRLRRYTRAVIGAAIVGGVIGAIIGAGLALWFFGIATQIATWFAVAGAGGGAVIGGLVGLEVRARYDADVAATVDVTSEPGAIVITTHTTQASGSGAKARKILREAGAVAFLDVASYRARERAAQGPAIVRSTSVGEE